jgi:peroxiredoxin
LIEPGSPAPDFRLQRLDGGEARLQELIADGPTLFAFFKVSCPVCQLAFPFLDRIHSPATRPVYGISQNDSADTREFIKRFSIGLPILLDREDAKFPASNAYEISSVPTMFLVERDGSVSRVIEGWNKREVEWLGKQAGVNPFRENDNVPAWKAG